MNILFFLSSFANSNFSTKFYILSLYLDFMVLAITDLFKDFLYWKLQEIVQLYDST